ncbi:glutamate-gated chloride channel alpha-like [Rhopilema esculentum]|uniref:glutamate-gated chloride channel alpha-like n=1 Tax=Rhopilema esculentum TaxID=499914 RepID=UPI0031CFD668
MAMAKGLLQITMLLACFNCIYGIWNSTKIKEQLNILKNDYDYSLVPVRNDTPVNVTVQISILDMFPYQSIHMHYSSDFFLKMQWHDYRLAVDKTDHGTFVPLQGHKFWRPDIYFPHGRQGQLQKIPENTEGAHLYLNGTVIYFQRITLVSLCLMELHFYPFDIQNCTFEISTLVNTNQFVHLMWDKEPLKQLKGKLVMKEFNIVKFTANATIKSTDRDGNYDYLQLHFRFYRYLAFYFLRDFFPCILIVILSWMTFWIDYQSTPARVAMGITTVLTIVTMTNNIRNNSPPAGLFRSIDYYLLMCNLFVFAALAEYALVGHYAIQSNGKRSKGKPKNDIKLYDFTGLGNMIEKEEPREKKKEDFPEEKKERDGRKNHRIDKLSRILFPTMFVIFNGIYFAFHRLHEDTVD